MLSRACLTCVFASTIFLSHAILGISSDSILKTSEDLDAYIVSAYENVHSLVEKIIQTHPDEQTFENTLMAWNRIVDKEVDIMNTLTSIPYHQVIQDVYSLLDLEIFQNAALHSAIMSYIQKCSGNDMLSAFQSYVVQCFLGARYGYLVTGSTYDHIKGLADDGNPHDEEFTFFNLKMENISKESYADQLGKMVHADVIYLEDVNKVDGLNEIYDFLKEDYAHFYTTIDYSRVSSEFLNPSKGILIVSKQPIEAYFSSDFQENDEISDIFFFDSLSVLINSSHKNETSFLTYQNDRSYPALYKKDALTSNASLVCKSSHKEKVFFEREEDENGDSKAKAGGSFGWQKGNHSVEVEGYIGKRNEEGKSKTEGGGEFRYKYDY